MWKKRDVWAQCNHSTHTRWPTHTDTHSSRRHPYAENLFCHSQTPPIGQTQLIMRPLPVKWFAWCVFTLVLMYNSRVRLFSSAEKWRPNPGSLSQTALCWLSLGGDGLCINLLRRQLTMDTLIQSHLGYSSERTYCAVKVSSLNAFVKCVLKSKVVESYLGRETMVFLCIRDIWVTHCVSCVWKKRGYRSLYTLGSHTNWVEQLQGLFMGSVAVIGFERLSRLVCAAY